ncbi:MAG: hypothetical protein QOJ19_3782 [Acidimicrobiia bacterium]|jgi:site-specific recombinase XerD|nr:hypothetical protein [Acidimicrobiia bacterium]
MSNRVPPLPETVLRALSEHLRVFGAGPDGLVFSTEAGTPVRRNRAGEIWQRIARRAGVASEAAWHELRHYYASLLIHDGASVKVVQSRLGHKSATETLEYGHLWPDSEDARLAVDRVLGGPLTRRDQTVTILAT